MLLITKAKDKAEKFFPITAVDFDPNITQKARNGFIDLSAEDELKINKFTGNKLNKFFERTDKTFLSDTMGGSDKRELLTTFKIKPILKDKVIFITDDINNFVNKIPSENNLIFCRNCWPYLWKTRDEFTQKISQKIDSNSILVTGGFDEYNGPGCFFRNNYGLEKSSQFKNVLYKPL